MCKYLQYKFFEKKNHPLVEIFGNFLILMKKNTRILIIQ